MTHILFITPYFPPEKGAAAVRISETAKLLVKRGYQVTVLTTVPNYPTGIVPLEYRGHVIQHTMLEGVRVVRVWSYTSPNKGFLRRILAQLSFGCVAPVLGVKTVGHPDVIIIQSPPLFDAIAGRILAWYKRCPFIFLVSDIWPESAIQLGALRNRVLIRLSEWLEWSTYQRASLVWTLTAGIQSTLIQRGLSQDRVFLLTNGVDITRFRPLPQAQARTELGWDDRFIALYAGTHGLAHGLFTVLEAAEHLRDRKDIRIVLVGDGAEKADLVTQAQQRELNNITFLEPQQHDRMPLLLAAADVCLVSLRKVPIFEGALPLKMFEAMACARPIVLAAEGEARRLAEHQADAALAVEQENAEALASAILYLREHREKAELLGQRGRAYVEAHFNRDQLTAALDARIETLLNKRNIPISRKVTHLPDSIQATPKPAGAVAKEK
jgi:colanic acid biosynthesis glycosyl transferase WcaI